MKEKLQHKGFVIIENIYSNSEIAEILNLISSHRLDGKFGVREFLYDHPDITAIVFNEKLKKIIKHISPKCTKCIKSIYFDKPPTSNWIVNWHQDLTINLSNKAKLDTYKNWRMKNERVVVQPNQSLLDNIFTIRIHLDNCTKENGALRVIEKSHHHGVIKIADWNKKSSDIETICEVNKGGVLVMKPLILHSSQRTGNNKNRRVIHIEFSDLELPENLKWKEKIEF